MSPTSPTSLTDLPAKIDALITSVTKRNEVVQAEKTTGGPWGWVVAIALALVSLVGIAIAAYYASKQAKELAAAKTALEQAKVDQEAAFAKAKKERLQSERDCLRAVLKLKDAELAKQAAVLAAAEAAHAERVKKLEGLRAWEEINAA